VSNVVSEAARRHMTVDQYLAFELRSPSRHEYLAGEVFAMPPSGSQHNAIAARLLAATTAHLRGSVWQAFLSEVKVRVRTNMRDYFYYPDMLVISDPDRRADGGGQAPFVCSPRLIAEVIAPATENIDRREKSMMYREIASLEEYVLVAQDKCEVTVSRRREQWRPVIYRALEDAAEFRSIGLSLQLARIYRDPAGHE
jgi:Uma2 family endonuclease